MYYIYELWSPITNQPFYVGAGKRNRKGKPHPRHDDHLIESLHYQKTAKLNKNANLHKINTILQIVSLGSVIKIKIVADNLSRAEADAYETKLISEYGRRDLNTGILTNRAPGGEGNTEWSDAQKQAVREKLKGKPSHAKGKKLGPYSAERIASQKEKTAITRANKSNEEKLLEHQNRSNAQKGKTPWNKGLTKDDPRVKKYANKKKGQPRTDMVGNIPWNKGLTKDSQHPAMQKLCKSLKGRHAPNKGKISPNKGKTYDEIYGAEKAAELKELRRLAKIKYWNEKP